MISAFIRSDCNQKQDDTYKEYIHFSIFSFFFFIDDFHSLNIYLSG